MYFLWAGVLFLNTFLHLQLNPKNGFPYPKTPSECHASPLDSSNPEIELLHLVHWPGTKDLISARQKQLQVPSFGQEKIPCREQPTKGNTRGSKLTKALGCVFLIIFN